MKSKYFLFSEFLATCKKHIGDSSPDSLVRDKS